MAVTSATIAIALGVTAPAPDSATDLQWSMWISDAEMLIETRRLSLEVDPIDEAKLDYVVREAVVAQVKKPDDATQVTVSVDDGSTSRAYKSGKGRVTILDEWWLLLGLTDPSGAYTIDMLGEASIHLPWCSLAFGALYCSCGADIAGFPIFEGGEDW
jgi:translation initiation factor IF-1